MQKNEKMKVAVYARFADQKAELLARASRENWDYEIFEEKETKRKTRPIKFQLYRRLLKKEFDAVLVLDLNAWGNSLDELVPEIYRLHKRGVLFITLNTFINLTNELTFCQYQSIEAFADFKNKLRSDKIKNKFFVDSDGITRSKKSKKPIGKRGKDRKKRKTAGYHKRMEAKR